MSQVMGGVKWSKRMLGRVELASGGHALVVHERWPALDAAIPALRRVGPYSPRGLKLQRTHIQRILDQARIEHGEFEKYLVTDHRVGRYFGPSMVQHLPAGRVIYVRRDPEAVTASFTSRVEQWRARLSRQEFATHYAQLWSHTFYTPADIGAITPWPHGVDWDHATPSHRLRWYCDEVASRWLRLKQWLQPQQWLELEYEDLGRDGFARVSDFTGIPHVPELVAVCANPRALA